MSLTPSQRRLHSEPNQVWGRLGIRIRFTYRSVSLRRRRLSLSVFRFETRWLFASQPTRADCRWSVSRRLRSYVASDRFFGDVFASCNGGHVGAASQPISICFVDAFLSGLAIVFVRGCVSLCQTGSSTAVELVSTVVDLSAGVHWFCRRKHGGEPFGKGLCVRGLCNTNGLNGADDRIW